MTLYQENLGWPEKLVFGLLTMLLFVAALFASLLALAAGGALLTMVSIKLWWRSRRQRNTLIKAEYQVLHGSETTSPDDRVRPSRPSQRQE